MPKEATLDPQDMKILLDALGEAQRIGMLGDTPLPAVIERSLAFVRALPVPALRVIDLGSGGGDPGLVLAVADPNLKVTLVDRREKRTDLLSRLVGRMELRDRVEVIQADVAELPDLFPGRQWDAVTSRGFGSPEYTAHHAAPLVPPGGVLLVSEPPASRGARWAKPEIEAQGFSLVRVDDGVAVLVRI